MFEEVGFFFFLIELRLELGSSVMGKMQLARGDLGRKVIWGGKWQLERNVGGCIRGEDNSLLVQWKWTGLSGKANWIDRVGWDYGSLAGQAREFRFDWPNNALSILHWRSDGAKGSQKGMQAGGQEAQGREAGEKAAAAARLSCNQKLASRMGKETRPSYCQGLGKLRSNERTQLLWGVWGHSLQTQLTHICGFLRVKAA